MEELEHASSIELKDPEEALKLYYSITNQSVTAEDETKIKEVELALSSMGTQSLCEVAGVLCYYFIH